MNDMSTCIDTDVATADIDWSREPALVVRLVRDCGAQWLRPSTLDAFMRAGGDRVILLAGDAVRFPEGQDVAVVLPELERAASRRFAIGVVPRAEEEAVATRFGNNRWPALVFVRDGRYVTTLAGMHDWLDYLRKVEAALAAPTTRIPGVGIPVVNANAGDASSCGHGH